MFIAFQVLCLGVPRLLQKCGQRGPSSGSRCTLWGTALTIHCPVWLKRPLFLSVASSAPPIGCRCGGPRVGRARQQGGWSWESAEPRGPPGWRARPHSMTDWQAGALPSPASDPTQPFSAAAPCTGALGYPHSPPPTSLPAPLGFITKWMDREDYILFFSSLHSQSCIREKGMLIPITFHAFQDWAFCSHGRHKHRSPWASKT